LDFRDGHYANRWRVRVILAIPFIFVHAGGCPKDIG
jgi:hypothetical protein